MKTVLIVDEEPILLQSVPAGLQIYRDKYSLVTARDDEEAVRLLSSLAIDLVVTDLKMPGIDGSALLTHIQNHHPTLPVIVMTAFNAPDLEHEIRAKGGYKLLEKPVNFDMLSSSILEALDSGEKYLTGISLFNHLQLMESEQKTCLVEVRAQQKSGYIYFNGGEIYAAAYGDFMAEEAVQTMLLLENVEIHVEIDVSKNFRKSVKTPLMEILMESLQQTDKKGSSG